MLTPILTINFGEKDDEDFFGLDHLTLRTFLDLKPISTPSDYMTAITTLLSMYWVFDVAFPKALNKTLTFLSGHVCKLISFKVSPPLLKVTNFIYAD